jgi:hypothetical protein
METFKFDKTDEKLNEIVFYTCLFSTAIYENDPLKYLTDNITTNKLKFNLGKICVSEKMLKKIFHLRINQSI